jgi:hypothetical protein
LKDKSQDYFLSFKNIGFLQSDNKYNIMFDEVFYEVFNNLPRQGPGDVCVSLDALKSIPFSNKEILMADIGCGTGFQTLYLARYKKLEPQYPLIRNFQNSGQNIQSFSGLY